jgi:hypothetical protein
VNTAICLSVTFDHIMNCCFHCITDTLSSRVPLAKRPAAEQAQTYEEVHRHKQDFLIVHAAVMPTSVLPAPHGSTMIPERARPLPNILLRLVS